MALATLFSFAVVAACIIVLRYQPDEDLVAATESSEVTGLLAGVTTANQIRYNSSSVESTGSSVRDLILRRARVPTMTSGKIASWITVIYRVAVVAFSVTFSYQGENIMKKDPWALLVASLLLGILIVALLIIQGLPQSPQPLAFRVNHHSLILINCINSNRLVLI